MLNVLNNMHLQISYQMYQLVSHLCCMTSHLCQMTPQLCQMTSQRCHMISHPYQMTCQLYQTVFKLCQLYPVRRLMIGAVTYQNMLSARSCCDVTNYCLMVPNSWNHLCKKCIQLKSAKLPPCLIFVTIYDLCDPLYMGRHVYKYSTVFSWFTQWSQLQKHYKCFDVFVCQCACTFVVVKQKRMALCQICEILSFF